MESPVVVDKPPEYHGNTAKDDNRGFPFDEEEGSGAWSDLAARHPDIAARLRQRPATWARKRRPSSQDATDDFADGFGGFDRFPFDDIPTEFREHFPSHWNRRFTREEPQHSQHQEQQQQQQQRQPSPQQTQPQHQTTATQTEQAPGPSTTQTQQANLPQYGLRNTVDLGQKSPADPSLVDGEDRGQRSMSAPPDSSDQQKHANKMSGQNEQPPPQGDQSANVRHIPIFVEGRDEPVINKNNHFGEAKQQYAPPPQQQPHVDREYFEDMPGFHHPPNFSRTFGTPFNKGFRGGTQPFAQQKMYPQTGFARGASPQRSQSPHMSQDEHFVKVPVHHDQPRSEPKPQQRPQAQQQPPQQPPHHEHPQQQQQQQQHQQTPPQQQQAPPKPQPSANDPITLILSIQTDVLNLMTEVENFTGSKKDKKYIFLDEMLTRNLIKLDNIETDGKENIRQARKEAIKCIQKCIAVLEAKADKNTPQPTDVDMKETDTNKAEANGEVEMKDEVAMQPQQNEPQTEGTAPEEAKEDGKETKAEAVQVADEKEAALPQAADTRQDNEQTDKETRPDEAAVTKNEEKNDNVDKKATKKGKNVKKRDKSKDKKEANSNSDVQEAKNDAMQVDDKGDKAMEVDGATPSQ